jgi:uncharacterized protein YecE (DUF72 family)
MVARGRFRVGTSGYQYDHWKDVFYPPALTKKDWFLHYAKNFDTVEINNTFYRLPAPATFDAWREQAPRGFCYVLKFSRFGSHLKRLKEPRATIRMFLRAARRLRDFLGPILVQLPPHWRVNVDRLDAFLRAAPRSARWAFEFRDRSWLCDGVFELLQRHNAALCVHDLIEDHPRQITADWVYLRFHGDHYSGSYSPQALTAQARWIRQQLAEGRDVFAYFNNDAEGHALHNAAALKKYVLG